MHRTLSCLLPLLLTGCKLDKADTADAVPESAILRTEALVFDAGLVPVTDRETVTVYVANYWDAPVTIFGLSLGDDSGTWVVEEGWATTTATDATGEVVPALVVPAGASAEEPAWVSIELSYRPLDEGLSRTTLTILSDDPGAVDRDPTTGYAQWEVVLRGVAQYACGQVLPRCVDFGDQTPGSLSAAELKIVSCALPTLEVATCDLDGPGSFVADSVYPLFVLTGASGLVTVAWTPDSVDEARATLSFVTNDPSLDTEVELVGNAGLDACGIDYDGDGWSEEAGDCDESDSSISPEGTEIEDGVDNDCDGTSDEGTPSYDDDGDGYAELLADGSTGDCDDESPWTGVAAVEDCDGQDNDCDGTTDEGEDGLEGSGCAMLTPAE